MASPRDENEIIIKMEDITKDFPGVRALDNVTFTLRRGEIHALVGENGAGKSTLIKILSGAYPPTAGKIILNGTEWTFRTPKEAHQNGVSTVYQEFTLAPCLSVAKNLFMGHEPKRRWFPFLVDYKKLRKKTQEILDFLREDTSPDVKLLKLGVGQQQMIEIGKALARKVKILVLDEPTSSLSEKEVKRLFSIIKDMKDEGISVIYISHRLSEAFEIADRITVLRNGQKIDTVEVSETNEDAIIKKMVGRSIAKIFPRDIVEEKGEKALEVVKFTKGGVFQNINLYVQQGEIVSLAGLVGAGRTELIRAIFGVDHFDDGEVLVLGEKTSLTPPNLIALGVGVLPEDRRKDGLVLTLPVKANIVMASLKRLFPSSLVDLRKERETANKYVRELKIVTPSIFRLTKFLSGGNQQKVVVAKWLCTQARLFIFDEPTRGIDVGAKYEIHQLMNKLAKEGAAILMISSELPEILGMSDRIYVMHRGSIVREFARGEADQEKILHYAFGRKQPA